MSTPATQMVIESGASQDEPLQPTDGRMRPQPKRAEASDQLVADELLVEEISIDGMCGVY